MRREVTMKIFKIARLTGDELANQLYDSYSRKNLEREVRTSIIRNLKAYYNNIKDVKLEVITEGDHYNLNIILFITGYPNKINNAISSSNLMSELKEIIGFTPKISMEVVEYRVPWGEVKWYDKSDDEIAKEFDIPLELVREQRAYLSPNSMIDWNSADWGLTNKELSEQYKVNRSTFAALRKKFAPNNLNSYYHDNLISKIKSRIHGYNKIRRYEVKFGSEWAKNEIDRLDKTHPLPKEYKGDWMSFIKR